MKYKVKISNFVFGVPATFIGYNYNAEQFKIIGLGHGILGVELGVGASTTEEEWRRINKVLSRPGKGSLILNDSTGKLSEPHGRILIKFR